MLAGTGACGLQAENHTAPPQFGDEGLHCGRDALETAKRRLDGFYLVLVLDWLHLSGPMLCHKLGWCHADELAELSVKSSNCGAKHTLDAAGYGWFYPELQQRLALDLELYEYAQSLGRAQLAQVGVEVPRHGAELELPDKTECKPPGSSKERVRGKSCPVRPRK
mmetsp:Transcript_11192/g.21711  ORF Transcript_11192/g.21711 Transcript_11192/m.21711 type:complete len:165 (+) Transcript_11192:442-936(+)